MAHDPKEDDEQDILESLAPDLKESDFNKEITRVRRPTAPSSVFGNITHLISNFEVYDGYNIEYRRMLSPFVNATYIMRMGGDYKAPGTTTSPPYVMETTLSLGKQNWMSQARIEWTKRMLFRYIDKSSPNIFTADIQAEMDVGNTLLRLAWNFPGRDYIWTMSARIPVMQFEVGYMQGLTPHLSAGCVLLVNALGAWAQSTFLLRYFDTFEEYPKVDSYVARGFYPLSPKQTRTTWALEAVTAKQPLKIMSTDSPVQALSRHFEKFKFGFSRALSQKLSFATQIEMVKKRNSWDTNVLLGSEVTFHQGLLRMHASLFKDFDLYYEEQWAGNISFTLHSKFNFARQRYKFGFGLVVTL